MQLLEAAMAAASSETVTDSATSHQLRAKIDAAEQGGVAPALLESARRLLRRLVVLDAKQSLEAALKPHSDWSVNQRIAVLKTALEAAEDVLGLSISEMAVAQQQQEEEQEQQPRQQMDEQQVQDQEQRGAEVQGAAGGKAEQQEGQQEKAEGQQGRAGAEQAGAGEAGADAAKASKDSSGAQDKADSGDARAAECGSGKAEPEQEQQAPCAPGTPTAAAGDASSAADAAGEPQTADAGAPTSEAAATAVAAETSAAADAATSTPDASAAGEVEATAQRPSSSGSASSEASAAPSAAAEEVPAASAPAATAAAAPGRITLESQPSLTSSVAAQSDAGSSAAGMPHAWSQGSVGGAADGDVEDSALVLELGLRAWRLLEADQAELAAIEKERQVGSSAGACGWVMQAMYRAPACLQTLGAAARGSLHQMLAVLH